MPMFHISLGVTYIYSICIDGVEYINIDYKKEDDDTELRLIAIDTAFPCCDE